MTKYFGFEQHYLINSKKFYNLFQAFDEQKNKESWIQYRIDDDLVRSLLNISRPKNNSPSYIKKLIIKGLKNIRNKSAKVRLALGGGTDSWTILKVCEEHDIFIDEVICCLVSINGNARADLEYLPALRHAMALEGGVIGKVTTVRPCEKDLRFVEDSEWFKKTNGPSLPVRPMITHMVKDLINKDDGCVTITGLEKPSLLLENGKIYWCVMDKQVGEWMGINDHCPLFLDKENPELTAALAYGFIDNVPRHYLKDDRFMTFNSIDDNSIKDNILDFFGMRLAKPWLNHHYLGKRPLDDNAKNRHFKKELKELGLSRYIDDWNNAMLLIKKMYSHIPHAIGSAGGKVWTTGRFSQKVKIGEKTFGSRVIE